MARGDQPRWPSGTPVGPGGKGPGGGRWRDDGKPNAPRASWAERMGRLIGRGRRRSGTDADTGAPDRSRRQTEVRRSLGLPEDASSEEVGLRIRQSSTTRTGRIRPDETPEEYGARLQAAVAASPYWNSSDSSSPEPAAPQGGDWAARMAARTRRGGDAPRATTIEDVRDLIDSQYGGSQGQIDEAMDQRFGSLTPAELGQLREDLTGASDRQMFDRTAIRAIDRMFERRTGQRASRGESQLANLRDRLEELGRDADRPSIRLADSLRGMTRGDLEDMRDRLRQQHAAEPRLGDTILLAAIDRALVDLAHRNR